MRSGLLIALLSAALLGSCNGNNTNVNTNGNNNSNNNGNTNGNTAPTLPKFEPIRPTSTVQPGFKPCNPYYPLIPGSQVKYTLKFSSGLIADVTVVVDSAEEAGQKQFVETTQIVDRSGGMEKLEKTVRRYVCDGERVQIVYEKGKTQGGGLANEFEWKFRGTAVLMVEPSNLKRNGTAWSYSFNQILKTADEPPSTPTEPVTVNFEAQGEEEVTTPAGKFRAIKIARRVKDRTGHDYVVNGLGLVKRVAADSTTWELREYSGVTPIE